MNNTQSIGSFSSNNTQNLYITNIYQRNLIPSVVYDLLIFVKQFESEDKELFSIQKPTQIREKLQFNNSKRYIKIFSEGINDYMLVAKVLKDAFPDSQKVVENIKYIFSLYTPVDELGNAIRGDGDKCLKDMHDEIKNRISQAPGFLGSNIDDLDLDKFVNALLQYGVIECQILLNPNTV